MPDKKQQPPKKKKPIVVSDKNDPRYTAYQDSLDLYNNFNNINKSLSKKYKTDEFITKKTSYKKNPDGSICYECIKQEALKKNIKGKFYDKNNQLVSPDINPKGRINYLKDNLFFDDSQIVIQDYSNVKPKQEVILKENKKQDFLDGTALIPSPSKKSIQPAVLKQQPREKQTPISTIPLDVKPINSNLEIKTSELSPIAKVPKKFKVETSGGGKFGGWTRTEEVTDFDNISVDKGNKRTITPIYALGGNIKQQTNNMNKITTYNEGGLHETNPNGGIPVGTSPEGQMNTVEQGEARMGDMIYSNRIPLSQEAVEAVGLPRKFIGKTPGDIMSLIDKTFKDRNDTPSQATKKDIADKVAQAQEMIKAQQEAMQIQSQEVPDMMSGQVPQGMEEFVNQNQMFDGGLLNEMASSGALGQHTGINQLTTALDLGKTAFGKTGIDTSGATTVNPSDIKPGEMGFQGALKGAQAGMMFGPLGAGIGGAIGLTAGLIGGRRAKKDALKGYVNNIQGQHSKLTSDFRKGGIIDNGTLTDNEVTENLVGKWKDYQSRLNNPYIYNRPEISQVSAFTMPGAGEGLKYPNMEPNAEVLKTPIAISKNKSNNNSVDWNNLLNKTGKAVKENLPHAMRLAPVAMNVSELARLKRRGYDKVNPILNDTRFKSEYIDEKSALNLANSEMNNTINSISQLGGSQGAVRNSILAASLNRGKQLSQSMIDTQGRNIATNQMGQQFNNQINEANIQRRAIAEDLTARNKGAYETNRSKLVAQIGTDIGRIGKEEIFKKIAENMTGYTWMGEYLKANPQATEQEVLQAAEQYMQKNKNLFKNRPTIDTSPITTGAYGGKMKFKKY